MNHRTLKNVLFLQLSSFSIAAVQSQTLTVTYPKQKRIRTETPILKLQTGGLCFDLRGHLVTFITTGFTPNHIHCGNKCILSSSSSKTGWSCVVE